MSQNNRLLFPFESLWPKSSDWLVLDEFTDTLAAGSVNGTAATPGPGTRLVTDTSARLSVGGGVFSVSSGASNAGIHYEFPATTGVSFVWEITPSPSNLTIVGIDNDTSLLPENGFEYGGVLNAYSIDFGYIPVGTYTSGQPQINCLVCATDGVKYFQKSGSDWVMVWVSKDAPTATAYLHGAFWPLDTATLDYVRVLPLPAPFDTDDGLATDTLAGSVAAGTTFGHEANALIEATITTVPSADNIDIVFRQQDASNYWICRIATGGDISLQEVVAGTPTQRGVAAGVVSNGHRVVIIADGTTIKGYSNNTLRWTYSSATNFATATAGEVDALGTGGAVSNLKAWPRTLSGTAASILNKASA